MPSTIANFLTGAAMIQRVVSLVAHVATTGQHDRPSQKPAHAMLMTLPLVFSHTTCRPITWLSVTQFGEWLIRRRKAKAQAGVDVSGHVHQTLTGEQLP